jgi:hypothetical protein
MGTDDLQKKNDSVKNKRKSSKKSRNLRDHQRKTGNREIPKILIMSDDEKSVVCYLKGLKNENRIHNLDFTNDGDCISNA